MLSLNVRFHFILIVNLNMEKQLNEFTEKQPEIRRGELQKNLSSEVAESMQAEKEETTFFLAACKAWEQDLSEEELNIVGALKKSGLTVDAYIKFCGNTRDGTTLRKLVQKIEASYNQQREAVAVNARTQSGLAPEAYILLLEDILAKLKSEQGIKKHERQLACLPNDAFTTNKLRDIIKYLKRTISTNKKS